MGEAVGTGEKGAGMVAAVERAMVAGEAELVARVTVRFMVSYLE